jgi:hypothetical protein
VPLFKVSLNELSYKPITNLEAAVKKIIEVNTNNSFLKFSLALFE